AGWLSPFLLGGALAVAFVSELALRRRDRRAGGVSPLMQSPMGIESVDVEHIRGLTPPARHDWRRALKGVLTRGEQIPYELVWKSLASIVITLFLLAMLLGSLLPPTDFDVKAYHLTGPKEYFLDGRITFLPHNVYTNFPFLTEMLCLLGMVLRQDWFRGALAGQAVLMGFAPLTALALFCAGRRWFNSSVGWLAATIYLSTPWTYRLAIIAYVEGALSCYLSLTLFTVLLVSQAMRESADQMAANRLFLLAGLFAGSAMACKYPGLVSVVLPLGLASGVIAWRQCRQHSPSAAATEAMTTNVELVLPDGDLPIVAAADGTGNVPTPLKALLAFGVGVAITIGPWLLKNLVETGNPVYPLAYGLFGGRDWDAASHAKWRAAHSPKSYAIMSSDVDRTLAQYFIDVTAMADWLSPLLFGFAPLAWAFGRWQISN
ncbi:MAG TPA: phospholipid carrier-dependent glycosyltransferase, partial [Planctomycetaceae bacterium]|nr:phospholipid carrier-dependent glycosyltransferase [Planctomycetaceae bacterium]